MRNAFLISFCLLSCFGCKPQASAVPLPKKPVLHQSGTFAVTVDRSLPIELVVAAGFKTDGWAEQNPGLFSDRHFPRHGTGKVDLRMRIVSFDSDDFRMTLEDQRVLLDLSGLRLADLSELLAFSVAHPCLSDGYLVAAADPFPVATVEDLGRVHLAPYVPLNGCDFYDEDADRPKPSVSVVLLPVGTGEVGGFHPTFYLLAVEK